ncbi:MAG: 2Fe-2S iron-sulfur cluster binding domain-containing protein [Dehalococcoidales bacterium]|nr:2Fe-2S iron-sulfur cluster binding domain-containing protein [Dehalococcoidales bacterium]
MPARDGLDITSLCAGRGTCHACKVRILSGTISPVTANERAGHLGKYRLRHGGRKEIGQWKPGLPALPGRWSSATTGPP